MREMEHRSRVRSPDQLSSKDEHRSAVGALPEALLRALNIRPSSPSSATLGRVALVATPVEKRAKGARENRDGRYRVRLEENVEHARRCGDRVWELG